MEIAIIGGGIVGLGLALGLHRRGIACRVYEAAPEVKEIGAGITLLPHAMREISALGLEREIAAAGIENRESAFFNRFGQRLYAEPRGRLGDMPYPEIGIHRGALHGILYRAALDRLPQGAVLTDRQLVDLDQDDAGADLHFRATSSGEALPQVRADVVIACDGVNSAVRRKYRPGEQLCFTGINTWRGVTRRAPIFDGRTYMRIGSIRTGKIVVYPIADNIDAEGRQLINWIAEIEGPVDIRNDWNKPGNVEDFIDTYKDFRFDWLDVPTLIRTADSILEYPMVDRDPIDRWTYGRATLAGDAAHPMYPRGSNGAAQGLIDARTLADLLAEGDDPLEALQRYEAIRAPATGAVVRANRSTPPDIINLKVEEIVGDRPFDDLDAYISQDELRALSTQYKKIAGFAQDDFVA